MCAWGSAEKETEKIRHTALYVSVRGPLGDRFDLEDRAVRVSAYNLHTTRSGCVCHPEFAHIKSWKGNV